VGAADPFAWHYARLICDLSNIKITQPRTLPIKNSDRRPSTGPSIWIIQCPPSSMADQHVSVDARIALIGPSNIDTPFPEVHFTTEALAEFAVTELSNCL
jgi:hypothetical protein